MRWYNVDFVGFCGFCLLVVVCGCFWSLCFGLLWFGFVFLRCYGLGLVLGGGVWLFGVDVVGFV